MRFHFFFLILTFYASVKAQPSPMVDSLVDIGYYKIKISSSTIPVFQISRSSFNKGFVNDPQQLWQGLAPGLSVSRPGSDPYENFEVRLRGLATAYLRPQPLYVLDGMPGVSPWLAEPEEMVSAVFLRGPSSSAIYGGRGASGAIVMNTLSEIPQGYRVSYTGKVGFESASGRLRLANEEEFVLFGGTDLSPNTVENTDWQDQVLRSTFNQQHHLNMSWGAARGTKIGAGFHFRDIDGILKPGGYRQLNASIRAEQPLWKNRILLSGGWRAFKREGLPGFVEGWRYAMTMTPTLPVRSSDPQFEPYGGYAQRLAFDYFNPVAIIEQNRKERLENRSLIHAGIKARLFSGFDLFANVARERYDNKMKELNPNESLFRGFTSTGVGTRLAQLHRFKQDILDAGFNYNKNFKKNNLSVTGGYSYQKSLVEDDFVQSRSIDASFDLPYAAYYLALAPDPVAWAAETAYDPSFSAIWGRMNLDLGKALSIQAGIRRERASSLPSDQKWASFPFFSAGFDFAKYFNSKTITQLKPRFAYGLSGKAPERTDLFKNTAGWTIAPWYNGEYRTPFPNSNLPNPELDWEKTSEWNYGLDLGFAEGRLRLGFDWYQSTSKDIVLYLFVPNQPGPAFNKWSNTAEFKSAGVETFFSAELFRKRHFQWRLQGNLFSAKTKVVTLGDYGKDWRIGFPGAPGNGDVTYQLLYPEGEVGTFWGPFTDGIITDGKFTYRDINRDGQLEIWAYDRDQTEIGRAQPAFQWGLGQELIWKKWALNFMFRGVVGHDLVHENRLFYENNWTGNSFYNRLITEYFNPQLTDFSRFSNWHVEEATFARLQYLCLSYTFPIAEGKFVRSLKIEAGGQNLFTITNYSGLDPDLRLWDKTSIDNGSISGSYTPLVQGIDRRATYPLARGWWLGVRAEF